MVGLNRAERNYGFFLLLLSFAYEVFKFPRFISASCQAGAIVPLDPDARSPELGCEAGQEFKWRWPVA